MKLKYTWPSLFFMFLGLYWIFGWQAAEAVQAGSEPFIVIVKFLGPVLVLGLFLSLVFLLPGQDPEQYRKRFLIFCSVGAVVGSILGAWLGMESPWTYGTDFAVGVAILLWIVEGWRLTKGSKR